MLRDVLRVGQALVRSPLAQRVFLAAAVALAVWAVWRDRVAVGEALTRLGPGPVLLAVAVSALHLVAAGACWRALVADLGARLRPLDVAVVFLVGQVARYVPGGVWQYLAVAEAGHRLRVPRRLTAGASLVALGVSVAVGVSLAVAASGPLGLVGGPLWLLAPLPLVALHPRVLDPLLRRLLRAVKREPLPHRLSGRGVVAGGAWALVAWLLLGAQTYVLAVGLGAPAGLRTAAACTGAFVVAWVAGLLVVVAPAGVGVREVVLAALLAGLLDAGAVVLLVLVSRVVLTVLEVGAAAVVLGLARRRPAPPAAASPPAG